MGLGWHNQYTLTFSESRNSFRHLSLFSRNRFRRLDNGSPRHHARAAIRRDTSACGLIKISNRRNAALIDLLLTINDLLEKHLTRDITSELDVVRIPFARVLILSDLLTNMECKVSTRNSGQIPFPCDLQNPVDGELRVILDPQINGLSSTTFLNGLHSDGPHAVSMRPFRHRLLNVTQSLEDTQFLGSSASRLGILIQVGYNREHLNILAP